MSILIVQNDERDSHEAHIVIIVHRDGCGQKGVSQT